MLFLTYYFMSAAIHVLLQVTCTACSTDHGCIMRPVTLYVAVTLYGMTADALYYVTRPSIPMHARSPPIYSHTTNAYACSAVIGAWKIIMVIQA